MSVTLLRPAALVLFAACALRAQSPCANTPAYSPCDLAFDLPAGQADPYKTVDLKAEFRSPHHRTFAMPAFWAGGSRMIIRFTPTEAGDWAYRVTSNVAELDGKTGSFTAAASPSAGFIRAANTHHWAYTEKDSEGLDRAHLWMGATEMRFAAEDDAAFRVAADARAAQKFNHLRGAVALEGAEPIYQGPDAPNLAFFQRLDERVRYLNSKGITADLILARDGAALTKLFPNWEQRRRFARYLVARYAPMHVTWQGVEYFEDTMDTRALLKEIGGVLKELDPYQHPRTSGARLTSAPLLDDGWMTFAAYGTADSNVNAIEHQLYAVPFVNLDFGGEDSDTAAFRRRLWNATMDGQAPTYSYAAAGPPRLDAPGAKQMSVWYDFFDDTRYWELEPYFDCDGGRALALEDTEYVVYIEKPGPLELIVEKHGYDVYWVNPIDGAVTKGKKFSGDHFTGSPPDRSHDWILHVVREGHMESMNRSYKFESRRIQLQEIESNSPKVPFTLEQPSADLTLRVSAPFAVKLTRETRATRSMLYLWTGDVSAGGQGYRVIATGASGVMRPLNSIAKEFPALMHLRVYGMNANGKVYAIDRAFSINP
ncbi:MAG TPA: DUF5060 domain-containing protein [Verrucomicrobiae bacterium]|nr:DUF5060 domain-containing protein [Verrucomicrobiae bacterium]